MADYSDRHFQVSKGEGDDYDQWLRDHSDAVVFNESKHPPRVHYRRKVPRAGRFPQCETVSYRQALKRSASGKRHENRASFHCFPSPDQFLAWAREEGLTAEDFHWSCPQCRASELRPRMSRCCGSGLSRPVTS